VSYKTVSCPSCGAPKDILNPGIIMYSCEYCGNAVYWDKEKVKDAGKKSHLPQGFTRLYTGASGSLFHKRFLVAGRARYSFGKGFWDEWYLEMEKGDFQWLTEDNHELAVQKKINDAKLMPFGNYQPGMSVNINGKQFHVQEVGQAKCLGLEGELPKILEPDESYNYVDASSNDGKYILSIEYDDDEPSAYLGNWLNFSSLKLDDEGSQW